MLVGAEEDAALERILLTVLWLVGYIGRGGSCKAKPQIRVRDIDLGRRDRRNPRKIRNVLGKPAR